MPKLKRLSGAEVIRALERLGFVQVRQKSSHVILTKKSSLGDIGCVVPLHKTLAIGTLRGILRQAGVDVDDFMGVLE